MIEESKILSTANKLNTLIEKKTFILSSIEKYKASMLEYKSRIEAGKFCMEGLAHGIGAVQDQLERLLEQTKRGVEIFDSSWFHLNQILQRMVTEIKSNQFFDAVHLNHEIHAAIYLRKNQIAAQQAFWRDEEYLCREMICQERNTFNNSKDMINELMHHLHGNEENRLELQDNIIDVTETSRAIIDLSTSHVTTATEVELGASSADQAPWYQKHKRRRVCRFQNGHLFPRDTLNSERGTR